MTYRVDWSMLTRMVAGFVLVAAFASIGAVPPSPEAPAAERTVGTVKAIDPSSRQIEVITGCGHALRVSTFHAGATCKIEVAGKQAPLAGIAPGQIVVVLHRRDAGREVAESIATLPPPDDGSPR